MQMKPHVLIAALFALGVMSPAAMALTLTNSDDAAYSVIVTMKDGTSQTVDLAAKGTAEVDCAAGCELALNDQKMSADATITALKIEQGKFVQ
jgi:VCBS repeat-containing protein